MEDPHRRYNPLLDSWIIVAPHRAKRPWQGQMEANNEPQVPIHDPTNPLCPGVTRSNGIETPIYDGTYVFTNDFPSLLPEAKDPPQQFKDGGSTGLFRMSAARGTCKVMCFHPHSNLHIGTMKIEDVVKVIQGWQKEQLQLMKTFYWTQIFENRGAIMGCSNPHPHCQIWASEFMPDQPAIKHRTQKEYFAKFGRPMLMDYVSQELEKKDRIVFCTEHWVVLVPFWALWPYETMILPKHTHIIRITDVTESQTLDLAKAMQQLVTLYDNLFNCTFPYSMGWHGGPSHGNVEHWQLHAIYMPPLLRSASVKKFMAGYEMVCEPQRDITPEMAAQTLKQLSTVHWKLKEK